MQTSPPRIALGAVMFWMLMETANAVAGTPQDVPLATITARADVDLAPVPRRLFGILQLEKR